VTTNLAPVVDQGNETNPVLGDRTFADDPATVAEQAALAVRGLRAGGLAAVAKHFPGHGATGVDSHEALPVVDLAPAELEAHLEAFRRLLTVEPPAAIMTAHLLVRALDPRHPATLSRAVLTGLLREELGYDGAVVSDSLAMAGIRRWGDDAEIAAAALGAGADVLLTPPDLPGAVAAVCRAVRDGRLAEDRLDEALRRAAPLRRVAGAPASPTCVGAPEHRAVADAIAARAVEVAADPAKRLPLAGGPTVVAGLAGSGARGLADALRHRGQPVTLVEVASPEPRTRLADAGQAGVDQTTRTSPPDQAGADEGLLAAGHAGTLVVVRRAPELAARSQDAVLAPIARRHGSVILVETGTSAAAWSTNDMTVLHTRCAGRACLEAAARRLRPTPASP
jgi:beta-N-acetylhexosaminidase